MTVTPEKVAEIMALPVEDRAYLAVQLLESLEPAADPDAEAVWEKELDRRCREMDEGLVECIPAEEVLSTIRKDLNEGRL